MSFNSSSFVGNGRATKFFVGVFTLSFMLSMTVQPLVFGVSAAADRTYTIDANSVSVSGTVATVSGVATASGPGHNTTNTVIGIDWNEDNVLGLDVDDIQDLTSNVTVTCSGSDCSVVWGPTSHDYASVGTGTYTAYAVVCHSNCNGNDGLGSDQIDSFEIVIIVTNTPPVVTLSGSNPINLTVGDTFTDPGATATDVEDNPDPAVIVTGSVDVNTPGSYVLTYTATDSGSLSDSETRTVNVNTVCSNGLDDDDDDLADMNDPGCSNPSDDDETDPIDPPTTECSDDADNDQDTLTDYPNDPGCTDANDDDETDVVIQLVISDELASEPTETTITVTWATNHNATSRVVWDTVSHEPAGEGENYGYTNSTVETNVGTEDDPMVTSHTVVITGLTAGTTYYFRPVSHGSPEVTGIQVSGTTTSPTTPPPPPTGCQSNCGGGGGGGGFIPPPLDPLLPAAPAPSVAPEVLGITTLPATSTTSATNIAISLFSAMMMTGVVMLMIGFGVAPKKLEAYLK